MMRGWGDRVRSYDQNRLLFNRTFRNGQGLNPVSKSTIERTVRRFMNHGSIKDLQRTGRQKSARSEEMQMDIAQAFVENPHLSLRRSSDERDVAVIKFIWYKRLMKTILIVGLNFVKLLWTELIEILFSWTIQYFQMQLPPL